MINFDDKWDAKQNVNDWFWWISKLKQNKT